MDPELDPQVRHAVERPAETARGPEDAQLRVRLAGEPARRALGTHWEQGFPEDAAPSDDRLAAAVEDLLAAWSSTRRRVAARSRP